MASGSTASGSTPPEGTPSQPTSPLIIAHPRDPGNFTGSGDQDVEQWIHLYERISVHNRWDPTIMLANVIFYLQDTARTWFLTHEETITSWDMCKEQLQHLFGDPTGRRLSAKRKLASRVQTPTESYITYIQDILSLCQKADPVMTNADKVTHILKGIADDPFQLIVFKDCATVDAVIQECRRFEEAKKRRITANFTRLPNTTPTSTCEDPPISERQIIRIVRRELEAMLPTETSALPADSGSAAVPVSAVQALVQREIHRLVPPERTDSRRLPPRPVHHLPPTNYMSPQRDPNAWRTSDDRPVCFHCHGIGHIARYCRRRFNDGPRIFSSTAYRQSFQRHSSPSANLYPHEDQEPKLPTRYSRSPSPYPRRSPSPMPRRSTSPTHDHRISGN
ncbi:unnamed protein product [Ixodes pacificus]